MFPLMLMQSTSPYDVAALVFSLTLQICRATNFTGSKDGGKLAA